MKKLTLLSYIFFYSFINFAQTPQTHNFYELKDYLYQNDSSLMVPDSLKSGSAKDLDRMINLWTPRLSPHGDVGIAADAIVNYINAYNAIPHTGCSLEPAHWEEVGPFGTIGTIVKGNGQIHRITFNPTYNINSNTIYAGSFYGGLWRSIDRGESWYDVDVSRELPQTSISGIAVSHQDSNKLFVSTGEGDLRDFAENIVGYNPSWRGIGPNFTNGVYKSTDYGQTWQAINTGFLSHFTGGGTARDLIINPDNDNTLFCATSRGFFRTQNALSSSAS